MKPIIKYSKSYKNLFNLKKDMYEDNKNYLKKLLKVNNLYKKQPKRKTCKNCLKKISKKIFFFTWCRLLFMQKLRPFKWTASR